MAKPIPILLLIRELGIGGSERQLSEIAKNLDPSRFEVHVGCFIEHGLRAGELKNVRVHRFPVRSLYRPSVIAGALDLRRYIRQNGIKLVHPFDYPTTLFAVPLARVFGVPVVVASQRCDRHLIPQPHRTGLRIADRFMHAIVVNCEFVKGLLIRNENLAEARIHLCHNGVDIKRFFPAPAQRPAFLQDASLVVGAVSALRPEKGMRILVDAFAGLHRRLPSARLVIVGDGPVRAELTAQIAGLNLEGAVHLQPATSDVTDWYRTFDIFVLPSLSEAFSNSLMEAMACGCAVIASNLGGNPELVEHGRTGLLFPANDSQTLAEHLQSLGADAQLRAAIASNAHELIHQRFSSRNSADRMGRIYTTLLTAAGMRIVNGSPTLNSESSVAPR